MLNNNISISESEWEVMKVLWEKSPQTLMQITEQLKNKNWSTTTIQTYLSRLVKKGALETKQQGKGFLYSPTIPEQKCKIEESKSFLSRVFNGSISSMVTSFIHSDSISEDELAKLKEIVEKYERDKKK